jgi:hypothetical protein
MTMEEDEIHGGVAVVSSPEVPRGDLVAPGPPASAVPHRSRAFSMHLPNKATLNPQGGAMGPSTTCRVCGYTRRENPADSR